MNRKAWSRHTRRTASRQSSRSAGLILVAGTKKTIRWIARGCVLVDLYYASPAGSALIAARYPNVGHYFWTVPAAVFRQDYSVQVVCLNSDGVPVGATGNSRPFGIAAGICPAEPRPGLPRLGWRYGQGRVETNSIDRRCEYLHQVRFRRGNAGRLECQRHVSRHYSARCSLGLRPGDDSNSRCWQSRQAGLGRRIFPGEEERHPPSDRPLSHQAWWWGQSMFSTGWEPRRPSALTSIFIRHTGTGPVNREKPCRLRQLHVVRAGDVVRELENPRGCSRMRAESCAGRPTPARSGFSAGKR